MVLHRERGAGDGVAAGEEMTLPVGRFLESRRLMSPRCTVLVSRLFRLAPHASIWGLFVVQVDPLKRVFYPSSQQVERWRPCRP